MGTLRVNAEKYFVTERLTEILGTLKSLNRKAHRSSKCKENKDRWINKIRTNKIYMGGVQVYEISAARSHL